ncbi:MAG: PIG-L family deacetylase, partial [Chloroflexota bacterium]
MTRKQLTIMAVHAHPDDEAISTGGVLARYVDEGIRTVLVTCTGGELGEIADSSLAQPENLAEVRLRELEEACAILRLSQLHLLGYRDSGMAGAPENEHPESFHQAELEEATGRLVKLIRREQPEIIITYDEQGFYGHPDHIKANVITLAAWDAAGDPSRYPDYGLEAWSPLKLYYTAGPHAGVRAFAEKFREAGLEPPFGETEPSFGVPDEAITASIDVSRWVKDKHAALMAHKTQMGANVFFAQMPPELFYQLFGTEA